MEATTLNDVKQFVMSHFASNPYVGKRVRQSAIVSRSPGFAPGMLGDAIEALVKEGLLEFQNAGTFLALTKEGLASL